ncbi:hypothetical protein Val02_72860 [Virgisporangium aliadipatigenens]|uniref:Transcription regulator PadR N-terminal domain-containing protein n=1 Tax=Virgisporangium aliadipatigenens TaxID=741659 RepID=A0A8J3YV41_9ACTN|nr:PadR family transcriptional regulator [Virgisporangium aliadipatigenens]GIJ50400.1 hypothetical protein Val02_72860 [Virgisporangium aliadipatigenens]
MPSDIRVTVPVAKVLAAFLTEPVEPRYGLDLMQVTGHPSGTLYPILKRLQRAGWLSAEWEALDAAAAGRPPRRYYLLTPHGVAAARREIAGLNRSLSPGTGLDVARPEPA